MSVVIGIDGGTESLRAGVYNRAGRCLGTAAQGYETTFSAGARAEQNPADWWQALGIAVRKAMAAAGVSGEAVQAIALATTSCSVVALDADGAPLRPAIIWMDVRAGEEAAAVLATGDDALRVNGAGEGPVSAEWMIPKALWIARHEPDVFARATTICEYQDFLTLRLTGRRAASLTNIALRWHYFSERGGWPLSLLSALDLASLADKWPAEIVPPGAVIGPLTAEAAAHLGLPATTRVVQGGVDAVIGMIGLGVAAPGQLALITGSSHLQFGVVADAGINKPGLWGAYCDLPFPGRYMLEGGQTSTGSIINWLKRIGGSGFDLAALNEEAAALRPGCDGLLVLDHFQGNRTPYTDPHSRGAFVGLTLAHGMPHLFRAAIEGICMGTRAILDRMAEAGFEGREIVIGGGAARSDLWLQIHADTAGLPVVVPDAADAPLLGAAILAFTGAGAFPSIPDGIAAMVRPGRRIEPRPAERALYGDIYRRYAQLYPALKPFRPTGAA